MLLDHVALTVSDRERSAAFYSEHFGLGMRVHEDEHLLILGDQPGGSLHALSAGSPEASGLQRTNHFGFRLADAQQVHAARGRLQSAGVTETEWQDDGAFARVQVLDPDGYRVELYAYAAASPRQ